MLFNFKTVLCVNYRVTLQNVLSFKERVCLLLRPHLQSKHKPLLRTENMQTVRSQSSVHVGVTKF